MLVVPCCNGRFLRSFRIIIADTSQIFRKIDALRRRCSVSVPYHELLIRFCEVYRLVMSLGWGVFWWF